MLGSNPEAAAAGQESMQQVEHVREVETHDNHGSLGRRS